MSTCPHGIVHRDRETAKLRAVFDQSAKSSKDDFSLNECLELGDTDMPLLFDTLLRFCLHCIAITADIEKAFLQIQIKESDRDGLRFLWFDDICKPHSRVIQFTYCRLEFDLHPSPSILQSLLKVVGTQRKMAANVLCHPFKGLLSKSPCK